MKSTLPIAFIELQRVCNIDPKEQQELLRFMDEFERLREEDLSTQGHSYQFTKEGGRQLWQQLQGATLKATYIPKDTQELLVLPSQMRVSRFLLGAYDPAYKLCQCIKDQRAHYLPLPESSRSVGMKDFGFILSAIAKVMYIQQKTHLSIDEMKESHQTYLVMRSKRTLVACIALFLEMGLLQGRVPDRCFSRQIDYECAPLFTVLRTLQQQMRAETVPVGQSALKEIIVR